VRNEAKKSFYQGFNAIFGKVYRAASELVVIKLIKTKCLPVLVYGLEVRPLNNAQNNEVAELCAGKLF